jgi:hypothetical protein
MGPGVLKDESRPFDEVPRGGRNEDLVGTGQGQQPRRCVDREASDIAADELDLARMDGHADPQTQLLGRACHHHGAADGSRGTIEHRQEAITRGADLAPAEAVQVRRALTLWRRSRSSDESPMHWPWP